MKYDFLDFSTLAAREHACREEVRLNRRLSHDIYLGVVPVTLEADGTFRLDGQGEVIEWLVQMRRLPAESMLDALQHRGALALYDIDRLAERLVQFYASLKPVAIATAAYRDRCLAHVRGNLDELLAASHPLKRSVVLRVQGFQLQLLQLRSELFEQRVRAGRIVEGHGDLRAEHICFTEPITVFDCIEFNEGFRQLDVAAWVGPRLKQRFQELSGDHPAPILVDFYKAYRASVRAKVAALRGGQLEGLAKEKAFEEAASHLEFADRYAASHLRPIVLVVGGLSGTGKTTLARALAQRLSAELLSSDAVRQDLFGQSSGQHGVDSGRFQPELRQQVYQEMFRRAADLHHQRVSVVFDATFSTAANTLAAHMVVLDPRAIFLAIECRCSADVAGQRIMERFQVGKDASEARPDVYEKQRTRWEEWPADFPQIQVDTEQPLAWQLGEVFAELSRQWPA